jgi:endonuclease YncB( thermonuclease family)
MGSEFSSKNTILYDDTVPFVPDVKEGMVVKVYDGDTFTIGFYQSYSKIPYRILVRLRGIDTPEMEGVDIRKMVRARAAQRFLSSAILGKRVQLTNVSMEKYGRLLADVHCDGVYVNQLMVDEHYAVVYDGKRKVL